jgi:O-antigen ligase
MLATKFINRFDRKKNPYLLINIIFSFFPISFVLGSSAVSINLILFCFLGIYYLKSKIFEIKLDLSIKVIILFFLAILFSTTLSFFKSLYFDGFEYVHMERLIKSILLFRFLLMLVIVYLLVEYSILDFRYFIFSTIFIPILVSLDIIFQYIFGFNTIGLLSIGTHNSGFFHDELIAGGFIQRFAFFSILPAIFLLKNIKRNQYIFTIISICILGTGILLSGNRMPLMLFLFGLILIVFFNFNLKKIIFLSFISLFIIFKFLITSDVSIKNFYVSFYGNAKDLIITVTPNIIKENFKKKNLSGNLEEAKTKGVPNYQSFQKRIFLTSIDTWKRNKLFGNGIKSFRLDCQKLATPLPKISEEEQKKIDELVSSGDKEKFEEAQRLIVENYEKQVSDSKSQEVNMMESFIPSKKNRLCSNHPHNYYLEILTEVGVVGFLIALLIALLFTIFILRRFKILKIDSLQNFILLAAIVSLIVELFPFRTSGSFFSTNNASYITLIASIYLSNKKILKDKNSK